MAYLTVVVDQRVRVSFSGDLLLSGISKLARQPYVLLCFAYSFSSASLRIFEPPTLTLIIPL